VDMRNLYQGVIAPTFVAPLTPAPTEQCEIVGPEMNRDASIRSMSGIFYCGDNLEILTTLNLVPAESVDLIYLDPPFNSKRTFNIVYKDSRAQTEAFKDHWTWEEAAPQYARLLEDSTTPTKLKTLLRGLRDLLIDDDSDLLAYLAMMAPRLFALYGVLKPNGALYLHCDPTASHYLKVILDAVFGVGSFTNEVIWQRTNVHSDAKRWSPVSDTLLYYCKGRSFTWNAIYVPHSDEYVASKYRHQDPDGRRYRLDNMTSPNPRPNMMYEWRGHASPPNGWRFSKETMTELHAAGRIWYPDSKAKRPQYKRYLDEMTGTLLGNVWTDIDPINSRAAERLGYPTQKPLTLLERIINASSNKGDLVLDPFCGCGTTIEASARLGRRWIGIDIARKAAEITEDRFKKLELEPPSIEWYPPDVDAALALAARSGLKFEEWVRRKVRAVRRRKHDRGIDGEAYFRDERNQLTHVLISVKGGKLNPSMVRELRGTIERERAPIGVLVTANEPSKEMKLEATHAGYLSVSDVIGPIPRLQLVTVSQLFEDRPAIRAPGVNVTEMPKPVVPEGEVEQLNLRLEPPKPPRKVSKKSEEKARTKSGPMSKSKRRSA
jgi:site-specific DNA-methyltransferase (adenine-specific)